MLDLPFFFLAQIDNQSLIVSGSRSSRPLSAERRLVRNTFAWGHTALLQNARTSHLMSTPSIGIYKCSSLRFICADGAATRLLRPCTFLAELFPQRFFGCCRLCRRQRVRSAKDPTQRKPGELTHCHAFFARCRLNSFGFPQACSNVNPNHGTAPKWHRPSTNRALPSILGEGRIQQLCSD